MGKRIRSVGKRVALCVTAAFIALIAFTAIGPGPEAAHALNIPRGFCAFQGANGLQFVRVTSKDVPFLSPAGSLDAFCENQGGFHVTNAQKNRLEGSGGILDVLPFVHPANDFPAGWFESLQECNQPLIKTGEVLPNTSGDNNRITDVYRLKAVELSLQIAYDIGSNELTGITGAIIGVILGVVKIPAFTTEWTYDVQDECQEIVERNTIQDISVDTQRIITDVKTLLVDVSTRASQTSVDAVDAKVVLISTALAALATSLTTETDEIDAALAALATSLLTETEEIDAALAAFKGQLVANQDQNLRLLIEEHLEECSVLASMLLSDGAGLLPLAVLVVDDMATRAEAAGLDINSARRHMALADERIAAGQVRRGIQSLCTAYTQIVDGR